MALVALAVATAPVPNAAAQSQGRPAPQELWRQFPLDQAPSRAEPSVSPATGRGSSEQGGDGLSTAQIAAIVLAMGFLLMLTTGVLAYATRAQLEFDFRAATRRLRRSWRLTAVPAFRTGGRRFGMRPTASTAREPTVRAAVQRSANALAAVEEALASFLAGRASAERTPDKEVETLKAKRDVHPPSETTADDHELQVLKAKRGALGGTVGGDHPEDVETLKAKLAGKAGAKEGGTTARDNMVEAKSVKQGAAPKTRPKEAAGTASKQRQKQIGRR